MAIINNNVTNVKFLRNGQVFNSHELAYNALTGFTLTDEQDGTAILARYTAEDTKVKTLVGWVYKNGNDEYITIQDVEGASSDIMALLGGGVSTANTVTAQLTALSGNNESTSAETSVAGAKVYANDLIGTLDHTDTAETGSYVSKVDQVDGIISTTKAALPSVTDTKQAKKVVVSVSEDKGTISNEKGTISSSAGTIVLNDNEDGGIDFDVNIDGTSIVKDANGVLSVASTALTQYSGDNVTVQVSVADENNNKTISSLLTIEEVTASVPGTVAHRFQLAGSDHVKIGEYIDIPKDSALVNFYLGHVDDLLDGTQSQSEEGDTATVVPGTGDTALVWIMQLSDGKYKLTAVDVHSFIDEAEFASGVTWDSTAKKARGVVDPTSETFLTVGANGFKLTGVQDAIDAVLDDLDANVSGNSTHVTVGVEEVDGIITAVTVSEDNIANADDLAALSAKTITALTSTNGSITTQIDEAVGCKTYDIETDASKIKMSGFTTTTGDSLSGITESDSVTDAFGEVQTVINGVDARIDDLEEGFVSGVSVNGNAVTVSNHVAPISISGATSAMTPTSTEAIVVSGDTSTGAITLGLGTIDCGTY